jgi:formamidopyrimidine-DNA glycosylase
MPELPEVETTKQGIKPLLVGQTISTINVRNPKLRILVPNDIEPLCIGKKIIAITRRAKYIIIHLSEGYILIHLGMSGHLRITSNDRAPEKHDHIIVRLNNGLALRFNDPRRFGLFHYLERDPHQHQLLAHLGPEPFSDEFNGHYLFEKTRNKNKLIKALLMDNELVVGI